MPQVLHQKGLQQVRVLHQMTRRPRPVPRMAWVRPRVPRTLRRPALRRRDRLPARQTLLVLAQQLRQRQEQLEHQTVIRLPHQMPAWWVRHRRSRSWAPPARRRMPERARERRTQELRTFCARLPLGLRHVVPTPRGREWARTAVSQVVGLTRPADHPHQPHARTITNRLQTGSILTHRGRRELKTRSTSTGASLHYAHRGREDTAE